MLNIYYSREDIDKEFFQFRCISEELSRGMKVILLVPEQFTLEAERNAFSYLNVDGLMDLEVLSQSRLGHKVLSSAGGGKKVAIDKYGRHMLLTKILTQENKNLSAYREMYKKTSFVEMANDFISEIKQYSISPEKIKEIISNLEETSILKRKLSDINIIYNKYEDLINGKYLDTEDYQNCYIEKIKEADFIKETSIWISGFDQFTPKSLKLIEELIKNANTVNVVLTSDYQTGIDNIGFPSKDGDLFEITVQIINNLKGIAEKNGIKYDIERISPDKNKAQDQEYFAEELRHLEKELYAQPYKKGESKGRIKLCLAANIYNEVETAATEILRLVRDESMRYKDILVICNDMSVRGSVIKRTFEEYNIPCFLDEKREVTHHPVVDFIISLIDITKNDWLYEDVFRMLKTELGPITLDECEALENYCFKYKIKGTRWKKEFIYGKSEFGEDGILELNEIRERLVDYISDFEQLFIAPKDAKQKTEGLYIFLRDKARIPEKIESLIEFLEEKNQNEYAQEASQIWEVVVKILDQVVALIGSEEINAEEYYNMLKSGFSAVEIGIIPPSLDQVVVGTMQRTRSGKIRALVVIGANDGVLPASTGSDSLLNEDEKQQLYSRGFEICKIDDFRIKEEKLAIYKTFAKPSDFLWMSCSAADIEGKECKPSLLFEKIKKIFNLIIEKDIISQYSEEELIQTEKSTFKYMAEAFRNFSEGKELKDKWKVAYNWYYNNNLGLSRKLCEGLFFTNKQEKIGRDIADKLYKKDPMVEFVFSPSRLEKFSRCPFAHFVNYGLKPEEKRVFEIAGREMGDVYHYCIMRLSEELSSKQLPITDEKSMWMQIQKEECSEKIATYIGEAAAIYKEGVFNSGEEETYRSGRMQRVCEDAAWALVSHVRSGKIEKLFFETEFGRSLEKKFPPIEVELNGQKVFIEGKIDRVDLINSPMDDGTGYVKIIDYKSGKEKFNPVEAEKGWKLQLMLYLKAAIAGEKNKGLEPKKEYKPAGVFYFEIAEPQVDISEFSESEYKEKALGEIKKTFKLDGVVLDERTVIESIAGEFNGYSEILPIKKNKEGAYVGNTDNRILPEEDFYNLISNVENKIREICEELTEGVIDIKPKKIKDETACRFCLYKSVCLFDANFPGCEYEKI